MESNLLYRILNAGASDNLPAYLQRKVVPSNAIIAILLFGIAIPFVFITIFFLPQQLAIFPALGALVCIGVWIANLMGSIYWSRLIICTLPITLGAIYNAYLSGPNDPPLPSLYLIELSFTLIPFVVYDLKEKGFLIFTSCINAVIILGFPYTKEWFTIEVETNVLRDGWLSHVAISLAIGCNLGLIYGLAYLNKMNETNTEKLLGNMDEKNQALQQSQQELEENLQKVEAAQAEERKRQWSSEGLTRLTEILRISTDTKAVYDLAIAHLVKYTKTNQAGIYLAEKNDKNGVATDTVLRLVACYAYNRKKYIEQELKPGQGLLGQCYLEKEAIYMTEVPQNYMRITSGLGDANPAALLLMPLKVNESVEGIIELAAFQKLEPHVIDFIAIAGESIAAFVQHNRISEETSKLLRDTIKQAEELQSTEEELRQNMEEMAATQEEIQRKERDYLRRIHELELQIKTKPEPTEKGDQNLDYAQGMN